MEAGIDLGILSDVVGFRLRRVLSRLSRLEADRAEREKMKSGLFTLLGLISANPGVSQIALAREIGLNGANVVTLLDGLERLGWAERRRDASDRRRSALHATPGGEEALTDLKARIAKEEAIIDAALGEAGKAQLFALLDTVYETCGPHEGP